jgi:hypothetical protein
LGSSRAKHANSERLNEFDDEKRMADQSICHRQTDGIAKALGACKAFNGCSEEAPNKTGTALRDPARRCGQKKKRDFS